MAYRAEILRSYLKPAYQYCEHKCSTKTSLLYRALLGPTATHGRAINPGVPSHGPRSSAKEKQISRVRPPHNTYLGCRNSVTKDFTEDRSKISFRDIPLPDDSSFEKKRHIASRWKKEGGKKGIKSE